MIVGGGPVGLVAACLLTRLGVRVHLIERNESTSNDPKAISLDDESLRTLGLAGASRAVGGVVVPGTGTRYFGADGRVLFHAGSPDPGRFGHPFKNPFAQPELERALLGELQRRPLAQVSFGCTVLRLQANRDGAVVETSHVGGGDATHEASFVLGCDGARSVVREGLGIRMVGASSDDVWLVADTTEDPHTERYGMHHGDPGRPHIVIPGADGRCRYEFLLNPSEGTAGDRPSFELVESLVRRYRSLSPAQLERAVNYRFHTLVAASFGQDRAFILGDAAHLMPPFAGQGLNSGIRDAANLCWKVAGVYHGLLSPGVLSTYEAERRPHVEATVALSHRLGRVVMSTDPRVARLRDRVVRAAIRVPAARRYLAHMRFRPSSRLRVGLVRPAGGGRSVGTPVRQPPAYDPQTRRTELLDELTGPGWAVVAVGPLALPDALPEPILRLAPTRITVGLDERVPRASPGWRAIVDIDQSLQGEYGQWRGRVLLVRPDRVIAACVEPRELDDLAATVSTWLAPGGTAIPAEELERIESPLPASL